MPTKEDGVCFFVHTLASQEQIQTRRGFSVVLRVQVDNARLNQSKFVDWQSELEWQIEKRKCPLGLYGRAFFANIGLEALGFGKALTKVAMA